MKSKRKSASSSPTIFGVFFLIFGMMLLIISVYAASPIFAFIGLGLTFWGALFLLIKTNKYVDGTLIETTTAPEYMNLDRIITDLALREEAFCIPSFLKEGYLTEQLEGIKETVVFIPAEDTSGMVSIEELVKSKFRIENPKGILVSPPGIAILDKIERENHTDFTKMRKEEFIETFPHLLQNLNLTKDIEIAIFGEEAKLKITGSIYRNLYAPEYGLNSISIVGCPIVNAAACALAKLTGKPVAIQKIRIQLDQSTVANLNIL